MITASMLSAMGYRVLILEQHFVPGGFTHAFKRKKWCWDVGVHAIGEVSPRSALGRVLMALTGNGLRWQSLGATYDAFCYPGDFKIEFPDTKKQFIANLKDAFPDETEAIDQYISEVDAVGRAFSKHLLARLMPSSLGKFTDRLISGDVLKALAEETAPRLARLTENPKLRAVLASQWGYYGSPPSRSSWAIQAMVTRHFYYGAFYPVGGAQQIALQLLKGVADAGGWTCVNQSVDEILIQKGKAVGVRLDGGEEIRARRVVSAVGGIPTVNRLLPEAEKGKPWARSIAALSPSPAHLCLYVGFKGDIREDGASSANRWFCETWDSEFEAWDHDKDKEAPVIYVSFPSLKDPDHDPGPDHIHTGEIVTFVPYGAFEKWNDRAWRKRGEAYEALKEDLSRRLLDHLCRHMPGLREKVAFHELSTPVTTTHFARSARGAIYGIEPTPQRFTNRWLRPRLPVKNLFMSGSDVGTAGVAGAMLGGMMCAAAMEPLKTFKLLRPLFKR